MRSARDCEIVSLRESGASLEDLSIRFSLSRQRIEQIVHVEAHDARRLVARAITRGEIQRPDVCAACARSQVLLSAHHEDYAAPLCVTWLCHECHRAADAERRKRLGIRRQWMRSTIGELR